LNWEFERMKGKIVLVTGATSGIGKAAALALGKQGATVIFTARDEAKGKAVQKELSEASSNPNIEMLPCDLASLQSIRQFCDEYRRRHDRLDVLINNAGLWTYSRQESKDGIEMTLAVNVLAPFLMTHLLLDLLKRSAPSRIVSTSSGLHYGTINFEDLEVKKFNGAKAYRQSKLGILLFTRLLARRLEGTGVTVNAMLPGMVKTNLGRDAGAFSRAIFKMMGTTPEKGADTIVYLASSPEVEKVSGECFVKRAVRKTSKESYDMALAQKFWEVCEGYLKKHGAL
jgi:NAD(P)-dependent dehydrogenase (short-subunit alcohol dehydrogenase family)